MGRAGFNFAELRFVFEQELTQVYVLCNAWGDAPLGVQGWHHKTFPASMTAEGILWHMFNSTPDEPLDDPILWSLKAP